MCVSWEGKTSIFAWGEKEFFLIWGKFHACSKNLLCLSVVPVWVEFASLLFNCKRCIAGLFVHSANEVIF